MGVLIQILSTLILCYISSMVGIICVWPSSTIIIFTSSNTTLHRPMTEVEVSLLGSLSSMAALIGTPLTGFYLDTLGRKKCSIAVSLTTMLPWAMISFSRQVEVVLTAIFVSGLSGSFFLVFGSYITEICQENIRGSMASGPIVFFTVGMLVSYVLGGCLSYFTMVYVNLTLSVCGVVGVLVLKESPLFLMSKGFDQEAAKSVAFYRNEKINSKEVMNEIDYIKRILDSNIYDPIPEEEGLKSDETKKEEKLSVFEFIKKSKSTRRGLLLSTVLMPSVIFQGMPVLQVYSEPLFAEAVPVMSANLCSIIFAVMNVIMGFVSAFLTDALGRRPQVIYGSIACGVCCLLLGSQIHLDWGPSWTTAVLVYIYSIVYMLGIGTVSFVVVAEIFVPEIKSYMFMYAIELTWLCSFLILFIFNPLVSAIGLGPIFYIFAGVCLATATYSFFFQPETKGLTIDAIQLALAPKKRRRYTQKFGF